MPLFCHGSDLSSAAPQQGWSLIYRPSLQDVGLYHSHQELGSSQGFADFLQGSQSKQYFQLQIQTDGGGQSQEHSSFQAFPTLLASQWRAAGRNQEGQDTLLMLMTAPITY